MGNHIAELIAVAEKFPSDSKARYECVRTILEIWAYKSLLPDGTRPFESLEPVVRTLEALDSESSVRFFAHDFGHDSHSDLKGENAWISLSCSIDRAARVVIQCCLEQAALELFGDSDEWEEVAKKAEVDLGILDPILLLTHGDAEGNAKALRHRKIERIRSRIKHLDLILEASAPLKEELQKSLKELQE